MRERFIKNKRTLNPTHISLKKDKQPKIKTTRRIVMMSQSNDDEEKETLHKRQRRQEDIAMRGSIDSPQLAKLLNKQQQHNQR